MIPLAAGLADSSSVKEMIKAGVVKLIPRGSRVVWEARVWELEAAPTS